MNNPRKNQSKNMQNQEEDAIGDFTCEICIEPVSSNNKFRNRNRCTHPFCKDCIAKYIEVKIEDHTANIQCPGLSCEQVLDPLWCREIIPKSVFSKWCDVLCDNYVLGFERSYCPNRSCGELVVNECGGKVKKSKCPNCKELFCFQCKLGWHAGYGCEESRSMREPNDILFGQLVEREAWIRCPVCGHCIERKAGCDIIKCRCKTYVCYKCGKAFSASSSDRCKCKYVIGPEILICSSLILAIITIFILATYSAHSKFHERNT